MYRYAVRLSRHGAGLLLCGLAGVAWAVEGMPPSLAVVDGARPHLSFDTAAPLFYFDIAAQPLNSALNQYADTSGQPALFPSEIVGARISTAVRGRYSAEAALHILLQGTGLSADKRSSGLGQTFVLKKSATPRHGMAELFSEEGYPGLVQARVWQALCANARTRPGDYSSLLRFYLEVDGRIGGARLIGTSGDPRRDSALLETLRGVHIGRPPPAAIAQQPLTMMIAPNPPGAGPQCSQGQEAG